MLNFENFSAAFRFKIYSRYYIQLLQSTNIALKISFSCFKQFEVHLF